MKSRSVARYWIVNLVLACNEAAPLPPPPVTIETYAAPGRFDFQTATFAWQDEHRAGFPVTTTVWSPVDSATVAGVVVISHGQGSLGKWHSFLGEHLASHGYLVAACNHFGAAQGTPGRSDHYLSRVDDLQFLLNRLVEDDAWPNAATLAAASIGHSIGGYSALALCGALPFAAAVTGQCTDAGDPAYCQLAAHADRWSGFADSRVKTCIGLTPFVDPIFGENGENGATLNRPVLLVGADEDVFLPLEPSLREFFEHAPQPGTLLLTIKGAGHLSFTDAFHEGSLDHDTLKATTNAYVAAWLDSTLNGRTTVAQLFGPAAAGTSSYAAHITMTGRFGNTAND